MKDSRGNRIIWLVDPSPERTLNQLRLTVRRARIVSFPRSGRTWLRMMLHELALDPKFVHVKARPRLASPPERMCNGIERYYSRRVLFLFRDPKDTLVSYYHHVLHKHGGAFPGGISSFLRAPATGLERILAFNLGWIESYPKFRNFKAVRYDDMRQAPEEHLAAIIRFFGCGRADSAQIAQAVAGHTFDAMKRQEQSGELHARFGDRFTKTAAGDDQRIVRRGSVAGNTDELNPEDLAYCDALIASYGYTTRMQRAMDKASLLNSH
ncbi:sulfotransferase domain-containing protein [Aestuariivirga sp.]|uniref:sulfotransferase domain-containing protein n=1 Tax=Aestuariivirga sp. TaxID=2650926 RepID=UPI0039E3C424